MIVVVADTSPLNYLIQIDREQVLPALFDRLLVPAAVMDELKHAGSPAVVRTWTLKLPEWLEIHGVQSPPEVDLLGLGPGEREAIQLAREKRADLLLMDERRGVRVARSHGLAVTNRGCD